MVLVNVQNYILSARAVVRKQTKTSQHPNHLKWAFCFILFFVCFYWFSVKRNCSEIYKSAGKPTDGVYTIKPDNLPAFDVFCDQTTAGGGWTVFQKRLNGSDDFYRYWNDYKHGFGDLKSEFWLGLDNEGNTAYAEYNLFGVMSEKDKYKLILGSYSGRTVISSLLF